MLIEFARPDDPFRVQTGTVHVAEDLDPRVLFTTRWPGAFAELLTVPVSVGGNEVTGLVAYGRAYSTTPLVLGAVDQNGGAPLYPSVYTFSEKVGDQGNWFVARDYVKLEASTVNVRYRFRSQASGSYSGTLKIWVIG
jgi:hypothetical protein